MAKITGSIVSSTDELLQLFPRKVEGLDVHVFDNCADTLSVVYFARNRPEKKEMWARFREWVKDNWTGDSVDIPVTEIPDDAMPQIYRRLSNYVMGGCLPEDSTLLFRLGLVTESQERAYVSAFVRDRSDESLKGVGAEVHERLEAMIRNLGMRFMILWPEEEGVVKFWKSQGYVAGSMIDPAMHGKICGSFGDKDMVKFLHENDRPEFLKPEYL
jgi:hypothetical protein